MTLTKEEINETLRKLLQEEKSVSEGFFKNMESKLKGSDLLRDLYHPEPR